MPTSERHHSKVAESSGADSSSLRSTVGPIAALLSIAALNIGCTGDAPQTPPTAAATTPAEEEARDDSAVPTITAANAFYYYEDVDAAWRFYTETLGLETAADYGFAKILRVAPTSYLTLVDAARGMHSADEPKTVTMALVTDEVEGWYQYLTDAGVPMRSEFTPATGRPHVGFVAIDPEGYLLEFERFDPHEENERLLPALEQLTPLYPAADASTRRPAELGVRATVLWLYYADTEAANEFYTRVLGAGPIVDQGWAWGYQMSSSGFLGIVDEERGLHRATEDKGVTVSIIVDDINEWFGRMQTIDGFEFRTEEIGDESGRVSVFVGYDPENTFLEWDTFLDVEGNERLVPLLRGGR